MRFLIGSVFVGTLLMWILWIAQREDGGSPRGAITASSVATGVGDLRIDLWVDKSRLTTGDEVTCTITIQNPTIEPVTDFRVATFTHEGLLPKADPETKKCWKDGRPQCIEVEGKLVEGIPGDLAAGASFRIKVPLVAVDAGRSSLGGLFGWNGKLGSRSKALIAAPLTIEKEYSAVGRATRNFVKELGFPVALAILGYLFKKAEDSQTRLRETWTVMFPLSHDRTEKHWMPLSNTLFWLAESGVRSPRDHDLCFFLLVRLWRQMLDSSREVGGFFMKAHATEEVLSGCWNVILFWSMDTFGHEREQAALALTSRAMSYSEFEEQYASRVLFRTLRARYRIQSENALALIASVAGIFYLTLAHEINRPYGVWYDDGPEEFDGTSFDEAVSSFMAHRDYLQSHTLPGASVKGMKRLRAALDKLVSQIAAFRLFLVRDRRRSRLGKLFVV